MSMTENEAKDILRIIGWNRAEEGDVEGCEAIDIAMNVLEEIQEYRAIGTVEECHVAVERMKPKKPIEYEDKYYGCPNCDNPVLHKWEKYPTLLTPKRKGLPYCLNCGQAIGWSEKGGAE